MIDQSVFAPQLRVFRQLDVDKLSPEFKATVGEAEGSFEWVDAGRARDEIWTDEIMQSTIASALVDANGQILRTFPGPDGFKAAEKARASARMVFDVDLPDEADSDDSSVPSGFADLT